MNVRKPVDYGAMHRELTAILAQNLSQMEEIFAIGKAISQRPEKGAAVAAAEFLQANFPDRAGFSPRNVRRMRDFYKTYENGQALLRLAMKIGWTLNVVIMESELTMDVRRWYLRKADAGGLSKAALLRMIESAAHLEISLDESKQDWYNFKCYTYGKKGKTACSAHHIRECDLTQIVLDDLRRVTHFARMKERQFAAHINQKNSAELRQEMNRVLRELDAMKKRSAELSKLFKRLYEDNVLGRVTDEQYRMLSGDYTDEQRMLEEQIPQKEQRLAQLQAREANVDAFIEKAKQYTTIDTLTPELLRLFIQRIEIGERDVKYSRNASQAIRIIYRDIGLVDSAMQPDEQQPKILPPLSEVIPFPA